MDDGPLDAGRPTREEDAHAQRAAQSQSRGPPRLTPVPRRVREDLRCVRRTSVPGVRHGRPSPRAPHRPHHAAPPAHRGGPPSPRRPRGARPGRRAPLADRRQRRLRRRPAGGHPRHRRPQPRVADRGLRRPDGLAGALPARARRARGAGRAVRPARARRRGRHPGPPAAEVRAVRRHPVRRPQGRALPGRDRGGGVRRAAPVPRPRLRHHRAAQRVAGPVAGAAPAGERAGAAGQGPRGGAVRDPGRRRRRVLARGRGSVQRHRRDRGPGLRR